MTEPMPRPVWQARIGAGLDPRARLLNDSLQERRVDAQYVTMVYATWNDEDQTLEIANAGAVQPLISRVILPWYGGTPAVWTTCMLFFQSALLAGYCYAHLVQALSARKQAIVHGCLLIVGLVLCKIMPSETWKPRSVDNPIPSILMLLAANVGVPYLIASTTGPLLQAWFAKLHPGTSPYRLYALSNVGSLPRIIAPINLSITPTSRVGELKPKKLEQFLDARFQVQTYVAHTSVLKPAGESVGRAGAP